MSYNFKGKDVVNGSFGRLYIGGRNWAEISEFELKLKLESKDVSLPNGETEKKVVAVSGEGKAKIQKVFSEELKILENVKNGILNTYTDINVQLDDPEALGAEAISISQANFLDEIDILSFKRGELVEREFSFGVVPSRIDVLESIEDI